MYSSRCGGIRLDGLEFAVLAVRPHLTTYCRLECKGSVSTGVDAMMNQILSPSGHALLQHIRDRSCARPMVLHRATGRLGEFGTILGRNASGYESELTERKEE